MTDEEWFINRDKLWRRWLRVKALAEWHEWNRRPRSDRASQHWNRLDALMLLRYRIMREINDTK